MEKENVLMGNVTVFLVLLVLIVIQIFVQFYAVAMEFMIKVNVTVFLIGMEKNVKFLSSSVKNNSATAMVFV
jgi:hypothetical protein